MGYPPRKSGDTSIGDSVNWEWIISCAIKSESKPHIMIVSRDGDFGVTTDSGIYLNDWLAREFKERVSRKRQIVLTNRLTDALKLMDEKVSDDDILAEDNLKTGSEGRSDDPLADLSAEEIEAIAEAYDEK